MPDLLRELIADTLATAESDTLLATVITSDMLLITGAQYTTWFTAKLKNYCNTFVASQNNEVFHSLKQQKLLFISITTSYESLRQLHRICMTIKIHRQAKIIHKICFSPLV